MWPILELGVPTYVVRNRNRADYGGWQPHGPSMVGDRALTLRPI
jgi:hypothetical protein